MTALRSITAALALCSLSAAGYGQNQGLILLYDNNDVLIGSLAEAGTNGEYIVWTPQLYRVRIAKNGRVGNSVPLRDLENAQYSGPPAFEEPDCSGTPYLRVFSSAEPNSIGRVVGVADDATYTLLAIPPRAQFVQIFAVAEQPIGGTCTLLPGGVSVHDALPFQDTVNDPDVTGVQNTPYTPPLKIESRPLSVWFELFKDGFESGATAVGLELFERVV